MVSPYNVIGPSVGGGGGCNNFLSYHILYLKDCDVTATTKINQPRRLRGLENRSDKSQQCLRFVANESLILPGNVAVLYPVLRLPPRRHGHVASVVATRSHIELVKQLKMNLKY